MMEWIFVLMIAGLTGPSDPYVVRDLTEAQCREMVADFASSRTFVRCYAADGRVIKPIDGP